MTNICNCPSSESKKQQISNFKNSSDGNIIGIPFFTASLSYANSFCLRFFYVINNAARANFVIFEIKFSSEDKSTLIPHVRTFCKRRLKTAIWWCALAFEVNRLPVSFSLMAEIYKCSRFVKCEYCASLPFNRNGTNINRKWVQKLLYRSSLNYVWYNRRERCATVSLTRNDRYAGWTEREREREKQMNEKT